MSACAVWGIGCGGGDDDSSSSKGGSSTGGSSSGGSSAGGSSSGGSSSGGSSSHGLVSCDIVQAGAHYCEEVDASLTTNTGCPAGMAGYTPGTGCSKTGVTVSCQAAGYTFYAYDSQAGTVLANICNAGNPIGTGGTGGGTGGTGSSTTHTCADLSSCCATITTQAVQQACQMVVSAGNAMACDTAYTVYATDGLCK